MTLDRICAQLRGLRDLDVALAFWLLFTGGLVAGETLRQLKGAAISSRIRGMEFTDEVHFAKLFNPDGSLAIVSMGVRKAGKWRIVRDELCLSEPGEVE